MRVATAAAVVAALAAYPFVRGTGIEYDAWYLLFPLAAVAMVVVGTRRLEAAPRRTWLVLAVALGLSGSGDVVYLMYDVLGRATPYPSIADVLYLASYPVMAAALVQMTRRRTVGLDSTSLIEAGIVTAVVADLFWEFMIRPLSGSGQTPLEEIVSTAYPMLDILLLAVAVRLIFAAPFRSRAGALVLGALVLQLVGDTFYGLGSLHGWYSDGSVSDLLLIGAYLFWGGAASHPTVVELTEPADRAEQPLTRRRLALLVVVATTVPALVIYDASAGNGADTADLVVSSLATIAVIVLAVLRMAFVVTRHEKALDRQAALRAAAAALVVARDEHDVAQIGVDAASALTATEDSTAELHHNGRRVASPGGGDSVGRGADITECFPFQVLDRTNGAIVIRSRRPLPRVVKDALETLASQVALAFESVVLASELLEESQQRYRDMVERALDAIFTADPNGNFTSVNNAAERISGYGHEELLSMNLFDLIAGPDRDRAREILTQRLGNDADEAIELELVGKSGRQVFVEVTGRLVAANGGSGHLEAIARDTTERHSLQEKLRHHVFHDALTGLPNRELLLDRVSQALARAARAKSEIAVMLVDVDDFKLVNDSLGHAAGDELLVALAGRLRSIVRGSETVARLGGDEFALVVENGRGDHEIVALAKRVQTAFDEPFKVADTERRMTGSLGIALATGSSAPSDLLRDADTAMYRAKNAGKAGIEFFDAAVRAELLRHVALSQELDDALRAHELEVHYQPIVSLADGRILAVEALVRWHHREWGWVQPGEFISLAEENGLIVPLGQFVLGEAARQAHLWRRQHRGSLPLGLFVNVSPRELAQPEFVPFVANTLAEHGLTAESIALELTERVFINDHDAQVIQSLEELAKLEIRLVLDDFGSGYSALSSLKRFPFVALKIDGYFIGAIRKQDDDAPVTRAVLTLGKTLGMTVIAEGVENELQLAYLRNLGCDAAQGFYLGRPQPAAGISELLAASPDSRAPGPKLAKAAMVS